MSMEEKKHMPVACVAAQFAGFLRFALNAAGAEFSYRGNAAGQQGERWHQIYLRGTEQTFDELKLAACDVAAHILEDGNLIEFYSVQPNPLVQEWHKFEDRIGGVACRVERFKNYQQSCMVTSIDCLVVTRKCSGLKLLQEGDDGKS
jgi:hypothetical protein